MKRTIWSGFILLGLVLLGMFLAFSEAASPKKITIAMTYKPSVQFAPWYVAAEKGYFREAGLAVNFDYRMDIDALPLVAQGQMDFAIAGGDQVITARAQGIPVDYLMSLYAKFPPTVVSLSDSKIRTPQDLKGKRIGLPLYGTSLLAVKAILNKAGIKESEVELVDIGYTQIPALTSRKVDAVVGFANNEPLILRQLGYKINEIRSWDYFSLVGHGLITGEQMIKTSPDLVRKMVGATLQGMRYTLAHPEEAFQLSLKYLPELGKDQREQEHQVFLASIKLWENDYTRRKGLGFSDPRAWEDSQRLMAQAGMIPRETKVNEFLRQEFLTAEQ
ncbi:MAG TPA: ABC transporter substrate-binding protein [Bacillota bacterium]